MPCQNVPLQLPTWKPSHQLVHIGTFNPMDKGNQGDSHEGHGLSASECPQAWESIAKLGGAPWWTLTKAYPRFLDWNAVAPAERDAMVEWAVASGFAEPKSGFRLSWHDADHDDRVQTTFENPHAAQLEFDAMVDEFSGRPGDAPTLEKFGGWKLTPHAMTELMRARADLDETPQLAAILYCESQTALDGLYWSNDLDVAAGSAPRCVIFPSRVASYARLLQLREETNGVPDCMSPENLYGYIVNSVSPADPARLAEALRRAPDSPAITDLHDELEGTVHYHAIDRAILMAKSGANFGGAAKQYIACAAVLRNHGAPVRHLHLDNGAELSFLDSDWSDTDCAQEVAQLMRETSAAGHLDFTRRIGAHGTIGGLMPLSAAIKMGNSSATQVLLELGCPMEPTLKDFKVTDLVSCARSFGNPNSEMVAALIIETLMRERLESDCCPEAAASIRPRRLV